MDDEAENLGLLEEILVSKGHRPVRAANGPEALAKVGSLPVDLVLMDVNMPGMNGFEACRRIKEDPRFRDIPVVMVTGLDSHEDRIRGIEAGVEDYFARPFHREELLARIRILLKMKRLADERKSAEHQKEVALAALRKSRDELDDRVRVRTAELAKANEMLREAEARYRLLFEHSPDGVLIIDPATARPLEFNGTAHRQLGYSREEFAKLSIFDLEVDETPEEIRMHIAQVQLEGRVDFEARQRTRQGEIRNVHVRAQIVEILGKSVYHCIWRDITERKRAEEERELTVRLVQTLHEQSSLRQLMRSITALLKGWLGCEAIGIRLRSGDDYPYFETSGFPAAFVEKENRLCTYDLKGQLLRDGNGDPVLDCMCGNVLCGRFDPARPFFTVRGSFWSNSTTRLLATTTDAERQAKTRNRCNSEGYESVALIPLSTTEQVFGLLQINDRRPDRFTTESIGLLERIADSLAIALSQRQAEEALRESERLYRSLFSNMLNGFAYCRMIFDRGKPSDFVYLAVNAAFESLTGLNDVVGKKVSEVIPGILESDAELLDVYGRVALTGRPEKFEMYVHSMKMWFSISVYSPNEEHFVAVFDVITDRKRAEKELQRTLERLRTAAGTTIQAMAAAVEVRDPYTAGHQIRTADLARAIADEMGLSPDRVEGVRLASSIHDIGKLSVPAEILSKPRELTAIEFPLVKEHSRRGYEILKDVESPWPLAQIVYQHHERMDGSGYPRNLKGGEILPEARILAVADVVESMASHRPYRPALGIAAALREISGKRGILYDPGIVDACLRLFNEKGYKFP